MEYLVMECHASYAVVLDSRGRFIKVANLGYQVGQEVGTVVEMQEPGRTPVRWKAMLSAAACLCILFTGLWQMMLLSMGTVLIQINPQIRLSVNRMERVISAEAVNADGAKVLFDYRPFGKTVEQVTQELSDRAAAMGYLSDGGEVHLTVDSENAAWKTKTEDRLRTVIVHDAQNITIIIEHDDDWDPIDETEPTDPPPETVEPTADFTEPDTGAYTPGPDDGHDDDHRDDHDDDDDDDGDDDDDDDDDDDSDDDDDDDDDEDDDD